MNAKVTMTTRKLNNLAAVIDIQGEINAFAESVLMEAFAQATAGGSRFVLLNFSGLEYMNSSGIGLLVTLLIRANRQKQRLFAYGLTEHYRQIFELTRLNEAILIFSSEAEALAAAN
jgi:anti-sigma B factor antagonist